MITREYLLARCRKDPKIRWKTPCWVWTQSLTRIGASGGGQRYGQIVRHISGHWRRGNAKMKYYRAHRASYEAFIGPIPSGMLVCHKCDNGPCINPAHLFLGTPLTNRRDCIRKKRSHWQRMSKSQMKRYVAKVSATRAANFRPQTFCRNGHTSRHKSNGRVLPCRDCARERNQRLKAAGLCWRCGGPREDLTLIGCAKCRTNELARAKRYRMKALKKGLCGSCHRRKLYSKTLCKSCLQKMRAHQSVQKKA